MRLVPPQLLKHQLHISRDTPFIKVTMLKNLKQSALIQVTRGLEEERGSKPVTVQFEKYTVSIRKSSTHCAPHNANDLPRTKPQYCKRQKC